VLGGVGLDVVVGQTGVDRVDGGPGGDVCVSAVDGEPGDVVAGGNGRDTGSGDAGDIVLSIEDRVAQLCYGG
jgi:Ca2+-binding RTX toxin-like protein